MKPDVLYITRTRYTSSTQGATVLVSASYYYYCGDAGTAAAWLDNVIAITCVRYTTCNRGDNYGGEEGAVPWELIGERKILGGVWGGRGEVGCKGMYDATCNIKR